MPGERTDGALVVGFDIFFPGSRGPAAFTNFVLDGTPPPEGARAHPCPTAPEMAKDLAERLGIAGKGTRVSIVDGSMDTATAVEAGLIELKTAKAGAVVCAAGDPATETTAAVALASPATVRAAGLSPLAEIVFSPTDKIPDPAPDLLELGCRLHGAACPSSLRSLDHDHPELAVSAREDGLPTDPATGALVTLLKIVACIDSRHLPGTVPDEFPFDAGAWRAAGLYLPAGYRPWFPDRPGRRRTAAVRLPRSNGGPATVLMGEPEARSPAAVSVPARRSAVLIPVAAMDSEGLRSRLAGLRQRIAGGDDPATVAAEEIAAQAARADAPLAAAVVATGSEQAIIEIDLLDRFIGADGDAGERRTPRGSCFAPVPAGRAGTVAFVYPGIGSPYLGLGRELFRQFPGCFDLLDRVTEGHSARFLHAALLYPRAVGAVPPAGIEEREQDMRRDILKVGECYMSFAILFTHILRDHFGVRPSHALGYSTGEVSMLMALGAWTRPLELSHNLDRSPTFRTRLHGPMEAISEAWKAADPDSPDPADCWRAFLVKASPMAIFPRVEGEPRVSLLTINTPKEVVIAGEESGCRRVIAGVGCAAVEMDINLTIHCPAVEGERAEFERIHSLDTRPVDDIRFMSNATYRPMPVTREGIAAAIADSYCSMVDFPRLVRRTYADGVRVFVETGARSICSTWIGDILAGRPYAVVPVNGKGVPDELGTLRALARLFAHRVPVDLLPWIQKGPSLRP